MGWVGVGSKFRFRFGLKFGLAAAPKEEAGAYERCEVCASLSSLFSHWITCWLDLSSSCASASCAFAFAHPSSARSFSLVSSAMRARSSAAAG